jgi:hypothetical protein
MSELFDKNGKEIKCGDIVKVFHFIGARRKRHYMYKQALGIEHFNPDKSAPYMRFSHLDLSESSYVEPADGRTLKDYEVVQTLKHYGENNDQNKDNKMTTNKATAAL